MSEIKLSVVVCTYNRDSLLKETLDSLLVQEGLWFDYEIIVVDNNSADNTRSVVERVSRRKMPLIRYVVEQKQGLSCARNRGAREARGEVVSYIDDDAIADKHWLRGLMEVYEDYLDADVVGGRIELAWKVARPKWFTSNLEVCLGLLNYGDGVKELLYPHVPFGGNLSVKRKLLLDIGGFNEQLGRKGIGLLSNEEVLLCRVIAQRRGKVYYTPRAVVYHQVLPYRMQKLYLLRRAFAQGISTALVERLSGVSQNTFFSEHWNDLWEMVKCLLKHLVMGRCSFLMEDLFAIVFICGKVSAQMKKHE